jgi:hypothetical protein
MYILQWVQEILRWVLELIRFSEEDRINAGIYLTGERRDGSVDDARPDPRSNNSSSF